MAECKSGICRERVGGPSEAEIEKKKEEANKDRPFSNPDRSGGTQVSISIGDPSATATQASSSLCTEVLMLYVLNRSSARNLPQLIDS